MPSPEAVVPSLPPSTMLAALLAVLACAPACTGPAMHIDNPDHHRVFVDGFEQRASDLPFRYYGTSRWDAQPAPKDGRPDWSLQPASGAVPIPAPAPMWLFPFDFPLELVQRALHGRQDVAAVIQLPPTPPGERMDVEATPNLVQITERALQARIER